MKKMKKNFVKAFCLSAAIAAFGLALTACSTEKKAETDYDDVAEAAISSQPYSENIVGQWKLSGIQLGDTLSINPDTIETDEPQAVMFTDSTYHFRTNCNLVQGDYTQTGDSISFSPGLSTRMACRNMQVEDALTKMLPTLSRITLDNDSTLRVSSSDSASFILLSKLSGE